MRRAPLAAALAAAFTLAISAPALAVTAIVTHSPDSLAPKNAPAHWLPPEAWVYNHWIPYDEGRLYRLLKIDRRRLWQQLRDDHHTVAELAATHGYRDPAKLAAALVAPRAASVGAATLATLRERAQRTLTQGHLAQHLFFHSLHQFAIPSAAPDLFGVTDAAFRVLRRSELSPLAIARLHGHFPGNVEALAIGVLRDRIAAGVREGSMTARQGALLLRRQLSQLPRWLDQQRYNGPPTTEGGALVQLPQDYASNPAISADGRFVAYEAYRQKVPLAVKFGEIAVLRADLAGRDSSLISALSPADAQGFEPVSAYNPSISGDGARVTYETSAGNRNFAKRYGRIGVLLCDLHSAPPATTALEEDAGGPALADSRSAYNPITSADGGSTAYQAVRQGRTRIIVRGPAATTVAASGSLVGREAFLDVYEPGLSADGTRVVFTSASGRADDPAKASSQILVRDLRSGKTIDASGTARTAADGAISPDGRFVAFTAQAHGGLRLYLRDLDGGRTVRITASGLPLDPVVSQGGDAVAFTLDRGARSQVAVWHAATRTVEIVSRRASGSPGSGRSGDPSISADGTRVAFSSTAADLGTGPLPGPRAIYVRDLKAGTTTRVSDTSRAYPVAP